MDQSIVAPHPRRGIATTKGISLLFENRTRVPVRYEDCTHLPVRYKYSRTGTAPPLLFLLLVAGIVMLKFNPTDALFALSMFIKVEACSCSSYSPISCHLIRPRTVSSTIRCSVAMISNLPYDVSCVNMIEEINAPETYSNQQPSQPNAIAPTIIERFSAARVQSYT